MSTKLTIGANYIPIFKKRKFMDAKLDNIYFILGFKDFCIIKVPGFLILTFATFTEFKRECEVRFSAHLILRLII